MEDSASWDGISVRSISVGARKVGRVNFYKGYYYANEYEVLLARLLVRMRIPFTPDVKMCVRYDDGRTGYFVPDFIFDKHAYIWTTPQGKTRLIHGIEAKGLTSAGDFPEKAKRRIRLLEEQRGIRIWLMCNKMIKRWYGRGYLPIIEFRPE